MSGTVTDKLNPEKMQQLLAAVGSASQPDTSRDTNAVTYDWRQPRYFTSGQLSNLEVFAAKVAKECVEEFSRVYQGDVKVSILSTGQYFRNIPQAGGQQDDYCIAFGVDPQKLFGLLCIPALSAAIWTGQILGGVESAEDSARTLSKLEESFVLDISTGLIGHFSRVYGGTIQLDRRIIRDQSSIALQGSEELFKIEFEVRKTDSEQNSARAFFLICCDKLQAVAGKAISEERKTTAADNTRAMREHVHGIPISLTVQLAQTTLRFKDVMDLQVNDILLLDKKVSDPVEILIENETIFHGRPVQSGGNHAVVIV